MSSVANIRVFPGDDEQWYYEPKGGNGEVLSTSEGYTRKDDAVRAATAAYPGVALDVDEPQDPAA